MTDLQKRKHHLKTKKRLLSACVSSFPAELRCDLAMCDVRCRPMSHGAFDAASLSCDLISQGVACRCGVSSWARKHVAQFRTRTVLYFCGWKARLANPGAEVKEVNRHQNLNFNEI